MKQNIQQFNYLVDAFKSLPGVGHKTAIKWTYFILKQDDMYINMMQQQMQPMMPAMIPPQMMQMMMQMMGGQMQPTMPYMMPGMSPMMPYMMMPGMTPINMEEFDEEEM